MRRIGTAVLCGVAAVGLAGCTGSGAAQSSFVPPPLATATVSGASSWVVVPMGHLDDPLNTFWQLFVRHGDSSTWVNATQSGVATNGGMVIAPTSDGVALGALPSNLLSFSSIVRVSRGGAVVTQVGPVGALAPVVSALASGQGTSLLTLSGQGSTRSISRSGGATMGAPTNALQALGPAGHACAAQRIDAIAAVVSTLRLGAACSKPSASGVFVIRGGEAQELSVAGMPVGTHHVVALLSDATSPLAVVLTTGASGTTVLSVATTTGTPRALGTAALPDGSSLFFQGVFSGVVALGLNTPVGPVLWRARTGGGWLAPLTLPPGTGAVGPGPQASLDAFSVNASTLTIWTSSGAGPWHPTTPLTVPIQYGSSG